jgi:hypothetical protein
MAEWDQRMLCPDGGCVGVIGTDGTCKVCGRAAPGWGDERNRGLAAEPPDDDDDDDDDDDELADEASNEAQVSGGARPEARGPAEGDRVGDDWDQRALCPDGGCVGVIGDDGKCTVCGRSAA